MNLRKLRVAWGWTIFTSGGLQHNPILILPQGHHGSTHLFMDSADPFEEPGAEPALN
jgi:hypothetical protein